MRKNILLSVDGSVYTVHAANLCFRIANLANATVTAHHVVDTEGAREFVMREPCGFVSSKEYLSVFKYLCKSLWSLGHQLQNRYLVEAAKHGISSEFAMEEGNPVNALCDRARAFDLLVIGHRQQKRANICEANSSKSITRKSFAESMSHQCQVPLLIVQDDTQSWKTLAVYVSLEHLNERYINACLDLAQLLNLEPVIVCVAPELKQKTANNLISDFKTANRRVENVEVQFSTFDSLADTQGQADDNVRDLSLPVIPTREVAGIRLSLLDISTSAFVHYLSSPSILLLPEEYLDYKANENHITEIKGQAPVGQV